MPGTRTSFKDMDCGFAQAIELIGDQWCFLIIRNLLLGMTRFEDFNAHLSISSKVLAHRLERLTAAGIIKARVDPRDARGKIYELTPKGEELKLVYGALTEWGDKWSPKAGGVRTEFFDTKTGDMIGGFAAVSKTGRLLDEGRVASRTGPGGSAVRDELATMIARRMVK